MKKFFVKKIHRLFAVPFFEKILLSVVKGNDVQSFFAKFIPPNQTYPNPSIRTARVNGFVISANINDYNDWKAYWGLKEVERENLYSLAKECTNIVDVGINNGWVLMHLATIVKPKAGFVYGFEPHPDTFRRSSNNIKNNKIDNVVIYNLGCGDVAAEMNMVKPIESNSGQNRVVSGREVLNESEFIVIKIVKLDEQLKDAPKIDLIKIDVEGFEKKVLLGAQQILQKWKPVLFIELDDKLLKYNNSSAQDLLEFLKNSGYKILKAESKQDIPLSENLDNCHFDIICQ